MPKGNYRKVFVFCVLEKHTSAQTQSASFAQSLLLHDGDAVARWRQGHQGSSQWHKSTRL